MDITVDHLEEEDDGYGGLKLRTVMTALAPLVLLVGVLAFRSDLIIPDAIERAKPSYYPSVAVVFTRAETAKRTVGYDGIIVAERQPVLRADGDSTILTVSAEVGQTVRAGEELCTLRRTSDQSSYTLSAPIAATVSSINGKRGTVVADGQPCVSLADMSTMVARGAMPERHAEIIRPGDKVTVTSGTQAVETDLRVVYPDADLRTDGARSFEAAIPEGTAPPFSADAVIEMRTEQILPIHVPFRSLSLDPGLGMVAKIVTGSGPVGTLKTVPVTVVATTEKGFYVEGLPVEARLVVADPEFPIPADGETVRIGRVG
jgi:multidrug efflux pump subunit AcrA (membrane-fusion protein)